MRQLSNREKRTYALAMRRIEMGVFGHSEILFHFVFFRHVTSTIDNYC